MRCIIHCAHKTIVGPIAELKSCMNLDDIRKIEQELEINLPGHYIKYITNLPTVLTELKEQLGELPFLYDNPEQLILLNQHLGFHRSDKFIKHKLCIGENGGGDYYLIDLNVSTNEKVYLLDHEESVENYYNKETDTWEWESLEFCENLRGTKQKFLKYLDNE